ncbi:MAG: hypothetical protein WD708_06760 [Kiritimatiellia bacterium]
MHLIPFSTNLLGLVADGKHLHLLHLRTRGKTCKIAGSLHLKQHSDVNKLAVELRCELQQKGWLHYPCIYALRSSLVSFKILPIPRPQSEFQLRQLVESHIRDFESLSASHAVTEYIVSEREGQQQLLICTAREDSLARELRLPGSAGLNIIEILPHSLAYITGIQYQLPDSGTPRAFVYIGPEQTDWMICRGIHLMQIRAIHISSEDLIGEQDEHSGDSPETLSSFQQWLTELEGALRLYRLQFPSDDNKVSELLIGGCFSPDPLQSRALQTSLQLTVLPNPGPAGTPAAPLGLALSGTRHRTFQISLLPPEMRIVSEQRRQIRYWIAACILFLVSFLIYGIQVQRSHSWLEHTLSETKTLVEEYEDLKRENLRFEEQNEKLQLKVFPLRAAKRNHNLVRRLLQSVYEAKGPDDWFILLADADAYTSTDTLPSRPATEGASMRHFILEGYTPVNDLSTVRTMIETLRTHELVQSADLLPDDQVLHDRRANPRRVVQNARWFVLEIELHDRRGG